eukprot:s2724_g5.t1
MLNDAGFVNIQIQVKENAADIIKDWMPGSGAEKYVTSAYVTAIKRAGRDNNESARPIIAANQSLWNWKSANLRDLVPEVKEGLPGDAQVAKGSPLVIGNMASPSLKNDQLLAAIGNGTIILELVLRYSGQWMELPCPSGFYSFGLARDE